MTEKETLTQWIWESASVQTDRNGNVVKITINPNRLAEALLNNGVIVPHDVQETVYVINR